MVNGLIGNRRRNIVRTLLYPVLPERPQKYIGSLGYLGLVSDKVSRTLSKSEVRVAFKTNNKLRRIERGNTCRTFLCIGYGGGEDSEIIYHKILNKVCKSFGKEYTKELQAKLYGGTDHEICVACVREMKLPISVDEFEAKLTDLSQKELPSAPLQKGAERLLTHFSDYDVPMALATNSTEQAVRWHATARPKLFGMFHHMVSATDPEVDRGKPHPDIYLLAASRFKERPKPIQCLVFEDSYCGVQAAIAAGMQVVMIPDPRTDREYTRQATIVVRTLMDFKPELFGLPPFNEDSNKKKGSLYPNH